MTANTGITHTNLREQIYTWVDLEPVREQLDTFIEVRTLQNIILDYLNPHFALINKYRGINNRINLLNDTKLKIKEVYDPFSAEPMLKHYPLQLSHVLDTDDEMMEDFDPVIHCRTTLGCSYIIHEADHLHPLARGLCHFCDHHLTLTPQPQFKMMKRQLPFWRTINDIIVNHYNNNNHRNIDEDENLDDD
jgi:hypothetical protein